VLAADEDAQRIEWRAPRPLSDAGEKRVSFLFLSDIGNVGDEPELSIWLHDGPTFNLLVTHFEATPEPAGAAKSNTFRLRLRGRHHLKPITLTIYNVPADGSRMPLAEAEKLESKETP
jgi:hypothetical protein